MKIKRPSLKGIKNTQYLGHFAQDKYIRKGHNLSGVLPMTREVQAAQGVAMNPFDLAAERQRRTEMQTQASNAYWEGQRRQAEAGAYYTKQDLINEANLMLADPTGEKGLNKKKFIEPI